MNLWTLPRKTRIDGRLWHHATDYREILVILRVLSDGEGGIFPWFCAMSLFYREPLVTVSGETVGRLMGYLADFLRCGAEESPCPYSGIIDWEADAREILEGVNAVAGTDIREKEELHWWTFLSLFHSISGGPLGDLVAIRWKLRTGKPLTDEEKAYVRACPDKFRPRESAEDKQYRKQLEEMLR